MSDNKIKLGRNKSVQSVNTDSYKKIPLLSNQKPLMVGDINKVINISQQFDLERNSSTNYRVITSLKPLMSNVLINTTGINSLAEFSTAKFRDNTFPKNGIFTEDEEDLTFDEALRTKIVEKNGWFGYINPIIGDNNLCEFIDLEPSRDKFNYISTSETNNWDVFMSYPSESVSEFGDITYDGLLVMDYMSVMVGGRMMTAFLTPVKHGLENGSKLTLKNISNTLDGIYEVIRLGLNNGDFKEYYFCIDLNPTLIGVLPLNVRMRRLVGNKESNYYFRKFTKIESSEEVETYKLGFSKTLFEDIIGQTTFTEDVNLGGLTDNLGRPISEIFLSIIKNRNYITESYFSIIKSGLDLPYIPNVINNIQIPDINKIHNGGTLPFQSSNPLETDISINDDTFYGDVVEYNDYELREKVLAVVNHRFNTLNRETNGNIMVDGQVLDMGDRQEGYKYTPFYRIEVREFSNYIEQGGVNTTEIPDYALDLNDGRFLWRDILDISVSQQDAATYPFLNGSHYIYKNVSHVIKRQDPFGLYGLKYNIFPRDISGISDNNNLKVKINNDDC